MEPGDPPLENVTRVAQHGLASQPVQFLVPRAVSLCRVDGTPATGMYHNRTWSAFIDAQQSTSEVMVAEIASAHTCPYRCVGGVGDDDVECRTGARIHCATDDLCQRVPLQWVGEGVFFVVTLRAQFKSPVKTRRPRCSIRTVCISSSSCSRQKKIVISF